MNKNETRFGEDARSTARRAPGEAERGDARTAYADIIGRPHHVSAKRPQMDRMSRAAQFSPFAALTGYDDLIRESERPTGRRAELDEDEKALLERRLSALLAASPAPEAVFTWFVPDEKKEGGEYVTAAGRIAKYDAPGRRLILGDGTVIPVSEIIGIEAGGRE